MKLGKTIVTVAVISLLAVPAMAAPKTQAAQGQNENRRPRICRFVTGADADAQVVARRGNRNGGGRGHGPGDGTGNGGNGPKDGTGPRSQNGTCPNN